MALLPSILQRYAVRNYLPRPVEPEKLAIVLEAARLAPSARNVQEWRFVVVQDAALRAELVQVANNQAFVGEAPVVIACCAIKSDYIMRCGHPAYLIDLAIAIEHIALQAAEEGLGTCWIGSFHEGKARALLGIPESVRVVEFLTLGYPRDKASDHPKNRLKISEIVSYEKWNFNA